MKGIPRTILFFKRTLNTKHYLKNTPLLTLSLTALILTSTADVAQSSNRYNSYDDAPYEIDSTDEFNSYFSFFDGDDDSSSFSPSEESYSEKSTKINDHHLKMVV
jgi:hypothetical protein